MKQKKLKWCLGFGDTEGTCENPPGSRLSPFWCQTCDDKRVAYIGRQLDKIQNWFETGEYDYSTDRPSK
jgi:hypothetical protein